MKKPFSHDQLSKVECSEPGCHTQIKENVVARKPAGTKIRCFNCERAFQKARGNTIGTAREVRTGKIRKRMPKVRKEEQQW